MRLPRRRTAVASAVGVVAVVGTLAGTGALGANGFHVVAAPPLHKAAVAREAAALPTSLPSVGGVTKSVGATASQAAGAAQSGLGKAASAASSAASSANGALPRLPGRLASGRPNVLFINSDDLAAGDIKYMPNVQKLLVQQGVTFTEAISPTPLCVPARASLLTGEYAHNHMDRSISGLHGGYASFTGRDNTLATWMQKAGYHTAFTGKYLNGYGEGSEGHHQIEQGWSDWEPTLDPWTYNFTHPKFDDNGTIENPGIYSSTAIQDRTLKMIRRAGTNPGGQKPWYLWANYVAPHHGGPAESTDPTGKAYVENTHPDPRDKGKFAGIQIPKTPDLFYRGPGQLDAGKPLSAAKKSSERYAYEQRLEAAQSVDRGVAATVAYLKKTGQYSRTVIIFSGDNGYATGQHNVIGKLWDFSQMQRIPMIMVGPGIPKNKKVATVVTNPDIATTIAALGGAKPQRTQDGVDITPALATSVATGRTLYRPVPIEAYPVGGGKESLYTGIRYGRYTYIQMTHDNGAPVLYDRQVDPYETRNLASDPRYAATLAYLKAIELAYRDCAGVACPQTYSPVLLAPPPLPVGVDTRGSSVGAGATLGNDDKVHASVKANVKAKVTTAK